MGNDVTGRSREKEMDEVILTLFLFAVGGIAVLVFLFPVLLGLLLFAIIRMFKRVWLIYAAAGIGALILALVFKYGDFTNYFALLASLDWGFVSTGTERLFNGGEEMLVNRQTHLSLFGMSFIFVMIWYLYFRYFLKKPIVSRKEKIDNQKKDFSYQNFRNKRVAFLTKKQSKYRKQYMSNSKLKLKEKEDDVFIGYSDFQERVLLPEKELNEHMLITGGTGTGKTTLFAAIMEHALRKHRPIIFMDGKGEMASMEKFQTLAEAYGRKVHIFSDVHSISYNPIKHGDPTEIRDKLMNLLNFTTEGGAGYYTDISSRYLQLVVKLVDAAGAPRDLDTITRLIDPHKRKTFLQDHKYQSKAAPTTVQESTKDFINQEERNEHSTNANVSDTQIDLDDDAFPAPAQEEETELTENPSKDLDEEAFPDDNSSESMHYDLNEGMDDIKRILESDFPKDTVEECLTRLQMQFNETLESDIGHLFKDQEEGIDLQRICDRGEMVIFSISGNKYSDYIHKLGKMIISDINSLVGYFQATGRRSVLAIYDEFSAYATERIVDIINKSRSAGFECIISTQTLADIDTIDPHITEQIITNCNVIATARVNSKVDAERLAEVLGTFSDTEITQQIERRTGGSQWQSTMGTTRDVQKFKAHPDEITNLQIGEIFLSRKRKEESDGAYVRRVYVRNALEGLNDLKRISSTHS